MTKHIDLTISPDANSVGDVEQEFVSTTMDWWPQSAEGWGNSSVINADLQNPKLIEAAKKLSPFFLRIGGSQADTIIYNFPSAANVTGRDGITLACSEKPQHCLTEARWAEVLDFAEKCGARIVFTLAYLIHTRDVYGNNDQHDWVSTNARSLLEYTANSKHGQLGTVYGFELGNELRHGGKAKNTTRMVTAYKKVRSIIEELWQNNPIKPLVMGPACTGTSEFKQLLETLGPFIDIATYHKYHGSGKDSSILQRARKPGFYTHPISNGGQSKWAENYVSNNLARAQLWIGEGAMLYNSGRHGVTNAFIGSLWFANLLGSLPKSNPLPHSVYCRQALIGGYYELISHESLDPNPDYWVAFLWKKIVGTRAIGPIISSTRIDTFELSKQFTFGCCKKPGQDTLLVHAFCAKSDERIGNNTNHPGDVVFIVINIDEETSFDLNITLGASRTEYVLTPQSNNLTSQKVLLNGKTLSIADDGIFPGIKGRRVNLFKITRTPPISISFIVVHEAQIQQCLEAHSADAKLLEPEVNSSITYNIVQTDFSLSRQYFLKFLPLWFSVNEGTECRLFQANQDIKCECFMVQRSLLNIKTISIISMLIILF